MAILQCSFYAPSLMRTTELAVILPTDKTAPDAPGYARGPRRLRTLYLLHGLSGSCHDWINGTRIARWAQAQDLAVVMPTGENRCYVDGRLPCEQFGRFVGEDLVAFTRRSFPLSERREDTFLGGLSMGGYGALRGGLFYHETFGAIAALSAAFLAASPVFDEGRMHTGRAYFETVFGPADGWAGSVNDPRALTERCLAAGGPMPRLFLACGEEDAAMLADNRAFAAFLAEKGVPHTFLTGPGGHDWDFWDASIRRAIDWLAGETS